MELYETVKGRRSIRQFKPDPVPEEVQGRLVEAAQWAPSWAHTQCCRLVLVSGPAQKEALQATLSSTNPARKAMIDAPVVVVFCAEAGKAGFYRGAAATPRGDWMLFDVALAMQNFMLAAHAEGLGTVCVGLFDFEKAGQVIGVPAGFEVVSITPLGYPEATGKAPPRKPLSEFAYRERFGGS